ncbi:MAG TPA: hypothetical protein VF691_12235 [Cytophagaceae bacterium]
MKLISVVCRSLFQLLIILSLLSCKKDKTEELPKINDFEVSTEGYVKVGQSYIIKGKYIQNNTDKVIQKFGFHIGDAIDKNGNLIENEWTNLDPTSPFEDTLNISPFSTKYYRAYVRPAPYGAYITGEIKKIETDAPTIAGLSTKDMRDLKKVSILGNGFGIDPKKIQINLYVKRDKNATPHKLPVKILSLNDTSVSLLMPAVIGTDPDLEPNFTDEITVSELRLENELGTRSILIDTVKFKYDFWVGNETLKGKIGDDLILYTYYTRKTPGPSDLSYTIDGIPIKPTKIQSLFNVVSGYDNLWFATRIYFKVPAGLTVGKKAIKIITPFGENFVPLTSDSDMFEVVQ